MRKRTVRHIGRRSIEKAIICEDETQFERRYTATSLSFSQSHQTERPQITQRDDSNHTRQRHKYQNNTSEEQHKQNPQQKQISRVHPRDQIINVCFNAFDRKHTGSRSQQLRERGIPSQSHRDSPMMSSRCCNLLLLPTMEEL